MSLLGWELVALWSSIVGYSLSTALALYGLVFRKRPERGLMALMLVSWLLHTAAMGIRWTRIGHLPVINMFEGLSANVWGLMAAVLIGYWIWPRARAFAAIALPIVMLVMGWMMLLGADDSNLPNSYDTIWLYIHIGFIKLFLGAAFVALGMSGIILLRAANFGRERLTRAASDNSLDDLSYRCMALALIFDTLGIVAGAIWAQDAWGRYWSWDKLEIWSLITWLAIGLTLHVRASFKTSPRTNALLVIGTFVIAFFTFFGIPFISTALHKGMV